VVATLYGEIRVGLAMLNQLRQRLSPKRKKASTMMDIIPAFTPSPGRLLQAGLALYLLPSLLVVLAVGALGMLVLAAGGFFHGSIRREACAPQDRVGQEIFRC